VRYFIATLQAGWTRRKERPCAEMQPPLQYERVKEVIERFRPKTA
jgi:hypothetical protein